MIVRPRRRRRTPGIRRLVRENWLAAGQLIAPLFLRDVPAPVPVPSMPGVVQWPVDERLEREVAELLAAGVGAVILFGIPATKDGVGSGSYANDGVVQRALRRLRPRFPSLTLVTDVCCCEYTDHGHCGLVRDGTVDNDATLDLLGRTAVSHAAAGADILAPSAMMDGMVGAIRSALDHAGWADRLILSYSVKYASAFYGPFREAARSRPAFGDRRQYQMDPANGREALQELELDLGEGADMVMVKPALAYLDLVHRVRLATSVPVVAYSVSGEYAMVKAAAERGWIDERSVVLESLISLRRAGADAIITYFAKAAAGWLNEEAAS